METWKYFYCWTITIFILKAVIGIEYNCRNKSRTGDIILFCCNNHEEIDGQCIECKDGYKSIDGKPCSPCPEGWWGRRCKIKCVCAEYQRCHHVKGCVNETSATRCNCGCSGNCETTGQETTVFTSTTTDDENKRFFAKNSGLMILYTGGMLVVVFICIIGFWMTRKIAIMCKKETTRSQEQHVQQNRNHVYLDVEDENMYESIDENDIDVENDEIRENENADNSQSSDNELPIVEMTNDRNSYKKLSPDQSENHRYKETRCTSIESTNTKSESSSSSVSSDEQSVDSDGYLKTVSTAM